MSYLIAGCGYVGARLAERLVATGKPVWGLRRNPRSLPPGVQAVAADLTHPPELRALPRPSSGFDAVFYLVSPSGGEDALYRQAYVDGLHNLIEALRAQVPPRRLLFASSTAVYAQCDGEWVDEASETRPVHFGGRRLLDAEQLVRDCGWPGVVVRFGGIYGPRRTRLVDRVRTGRATYRPDPPRYTNRVHRDDCAGVLEHLMRLDDPHGVYLGVDSEPAPEVAVLRWLAGALGAPEPRAVADAEWERSARGLGVSATGARPRTNKRCRNDRLLGSGYTFLYPTFREGYRAVLEEGV